MKPKSSKEIKINIDGKALNCFIEKRKRKSISIKVNENEEIEILCPYRVNYDYIEKIVIDKSEWIESALKRVRTAAKEKANLENNIKEKYLFMGNEYKVKITNEKIEKDYEIENEYIVLHGNKSREKSIIKKFYREKAEEILKSRTEYYSAVIGVKPEIIKVKQLIRSWGICSSRKSITYNWKLVMAPMEVIDYVIIHELCHLIHHNHSKEFWNEVIKYMPDYKKKKEWLRLNGVKIEIIAKKTA